MRNSECLSEEQPLRPETGAGRKFGGEWWQKYGGRKKRWSCFPQPSESLDTENHQPHDHNSLPPTSVFPFPVHHSINPAFGIILLMFRIILATAKSVQSRSTITLRYTRPFTPDTSTRQQSSLAQTPFRDSIETPDSDLGSLLADCAVSCPPFTVIKNATESKTQQTQKLHAHDDGRAEDTATPLGDIQDVPETAPATAIKRRMGRPPKAPKPIAPKGPPKKRGPKPKPKVEKPERIPKPLGRPPGTRNHVPSKTSPRPSKLRIEQTENISAQGSTITFSKLESRSKRSDFTSGNIRKDILSYLAWAGGKGRSLGDISRINIVSESLCDDTIERLRPSLQKHIGCDIIEVNPGVGIWSEKLHDILKPRTHILLEPDHRLYQPLLQPLIDAPGSTYRLIPKSGLIWGHLEKILSEEYLPHQEPIPRGDSRMEKRNDTLLFVANLGQYPKRAYRGFSSIANLVLYQFMSAARNHSLFQRYGHVRMLIWIENEERDTLLPQSVSLRRKSAVEAEISCEYIQEIASGVTAKDSYSRERALEFERTRMVYEKMKEAGITIPPGRETDIIKEIVAGKTVDEHKQFTPAFAEELKAMEARYATGEIGVWEYDGTRRRRSAKEKPRQSESPELQRLKSLQYQEKFQKRKFEKVNALKTEFNAIFAMQQRFHKTKAPEERQALEKELKERTDAWRGDVNETSQETQDMLFAQLDNMRVFDANPPVLVWDRREFEPLQVYPREFRPQRDMCLLDIQPKSLWPILQKDFPANYDVFEFIISQLFIIPTQSIRRGLSALAPGAYEYLIAECPSLTDPTKGGSLDVDLMSVRRLTQEMLKEIMEAWVRWPFKPTRWEVMSQLGSTAYDADEVEPED